MSSLDRTSVVYERVIRGPALAAAGETNDHSPQRRRSYIVTIERSGYALWVEEFDGFEEIDLAFIEYYPTGYGDNHGRELAIERAVRLAMRYVPELGTAEAQQ